MTEATVLSIQHARRLARGRVRIDRDEIDPELWHISLPSNRLCGETHAPMTREQWLAFLTTSPLCN